MPAAATVLHEGEGWEDPSRAAILGGPAALALVSIGDVLAQALESTGQSVYDRTIMAKQVQCEWYVPAAWPCPHLSD